MNPLMNRVWTDDLNNKIFEKEVLVAAV